MSESLETVGSDAPRKAAVDIADAESQGYWLCACVKRNRSGVMTHLKMNHPSVEHCEVCNTTQAESKRIEQEVKGAPCDESAGVPETHYGMPFQRWNELTFGSATRMTPEEVAEGWHWCASFDGLLIHPRSPEMEFCDCFDSQQDNCDKHDERK